MRKPGLWLCIRGALTLFARPGKSALHWAAAVNNQEAAAVLLKNGANKDMQNNKVSQEASHTPHRPANPSGFGGSLL